MRELFNAEKIRVIDKYYKYIEYYEVENNDKYIILDLRTSKEFNYKNLKGSIHFPLLDDEKSLSLEGMFENKTYLKTSLRSIFYIIPELKKINKKIKEYEKDKIVVLACRHARIRSRYIAAFVNVLGSNTLVLKYGVNSLLNINKSDVIN